jgi:hypothetical protein
MSQPSLAEPIEIAKFWRNRKGEAIIVNRAVIEARERGLLDDGDAK